MLVDNEERDITEKFAVIDTETNWYDEVMSIGVVVAETETMKKIDTVYYVIDPEYKVGGMFSDELFYHDDEACIVSRNQALQELRKWLDAYHVQKLFAYNARFDKGHLPEYSMYQWYDIMRLAAYRQYNKAIPDFADCYKTGKLKRGYGVESILNMFRENHEYREVHNAVMDAEDELQIMQLLGHGIQEYDIALIPNKIS
ncbi:MAG: hypothetical protein NC225_00405 [Clostridium sp.]|nr:hypothetical protein [Clostridium sp.]MCM1459160.1 hypothetical protein [Bacteroides sp.]